MLGKHSLCEQGMFMGWLLLKLAFCVWSGQKDIMHVCGGGGRGDVLSQDSVSIQNSLDQ